MFNSMLPLSGYTVAVTAARKADELIELLERQGADIYHAPALRSIALEDLRELQQAVQYLIAHPIDTMIVTTGVGFRSLMEAAERWNLHTHLVASFRNSRIITRGSKATGAIRSYGLTESWSPLTETSAELVERLLQEDVQDKHIAVQLHGATPEWDPHVNIVESLTAAGAQVTPLPVYKWSLPEDTAPIAHLINQICHHLVDIVTFTSAPAVLSLFDIARQTRQYSQLISKFQHDCLVLCVGPVTAAPLIQRNIPCLIPERSRLVAMVRELTQHISAQTYQV